MQAFEVGQIGEQVVALCRVGCEQSGAGEVGDAGEHLRNLVRTAV